jgi:long-chain acyl-CoA synthetase
VGLVAPNGPGFLASLLAVWREGLSALLMDAQTPETESRRIARALGAPAVLHCRCGWPSGPDDWRVSRLPTPSPLAAPGDAVIKLTSGSTGLPRGIATPAEALLADDAALTATMGILKEDRLLTTIPLSHSYGLSSLVMPCLTRGAVLALPDARSALCPLDAARESEATVFPTVPATLDALVRLAEPPPYPPSLRLVITAGAPLSAETSRRFFALYGEPVHVFYGASECGGICYDRVGGGAERGTVGEPVEGVKVALSPVPGGNPDEGLVTVRSAAVARTYLPAACDRLSGGTFVAGDLAVFAGFAGGEIVLRGRLDDLVNVKGRKVNPREVEAVLSELAGVDEAVALGVVPPGRTEEVLRAVVACRPGGLTTGEVLAWCREHLAAHKVPRSVILVPELPRTARGKLDRCALAALRAGTAGG